MRLLTYYENNISLNHIWHLLPLSLKLNCVAVCHTFLNIYQKGFALINKALTSTIRTFSRKDFSFSLTSTAWLLHLHLHHSHVYILDHLTFAFTSWTCLKFSSLGTTSFTFIAIDISVYSELALSPFI